MADNCRKVLARVASTTDSAIFMSDLGVGAVKARCAYIIRGDIG